MVKTKKETIKKDTKKKPEKKVVVKAKKTETKKVETKKKLVEKKIEKKTEKKIQDKTESKIVDDNQYFKAVGRRKSAVANVRLFTKDKKEFIINDKLMEDYFPTFQLREDCSSALKKMKCLEKFRVVVKVSGGGINAQAEAVRHGTARALYLFNPDFKKRLRRAGYLTRDPRQRERKKFGLKRARRAPQWKKR